MKATLTSFAALLVLTVAADSAGEPTAPQVKPLTADDLGMARHKNIFTDSQMFLFNGWQRLHAKQWSTTAFFMDGYDFHFNFVEKRSGVRIIDDVSQAHGNPLGFNFRPGAPFCIVAQDNTWFPHKSVRTGTFHKRLKTGMTSFAIEATTRVAKPPCRAVVSITLTNRDTEPLTLTLQPVQNGKSLLSLPMGSRVVGVSSDLAETQGQGFVWTLPPNTTETHHFVIADSTPGKQTPSGGNRDAAALAAQCEKEGQEQISRITSRIPAVTTQSRQLGDLYKRCVGSLALCRWEGAGFRRQPAWVVADWTLAVLVWDFSFAADTMPLVDPQGIRNAVKDILAIGKMKSSWIDARKPSGLPGYYLQDPFALRQILGRYILLTGDASILDDKAGDATIYEWLKRWGDKLHDSFMNGPGGLIDVGQNEQLLIEIRTSDYTRAVPVVNGLAVDYFQWLSKLAASRNDPNSAKFAQYADLLKKALNEQMWNEKEGWFDCVLDGGERKPVYSYHLLDLLGTDILTGPQRSALESHLKEGEFLAEYGMYSISRKDTIHWDRQDADFGGGGSYSGMPFRISRNLYEHGQPAVGWDILKRMARLADYYCMVPQSPQAEAPEWNPRGGTMDICCASAMEAVWSGIFGLRPQEDGSMIVDPAPFNPEVGEAELSGYQFRKHRYDVRLGKTGYHVFVDGKSGSETPYGHPTTLPAETGR